MPSSVLLLRNLNNKLNPHIFAVFNMKGLKLHICRFIVFTVQLKNDEKRGESRTCPLLEFLSDIPLISSMMSPGSANMSAWATPPRSSSNTNTRLSRYLRETEEPWERQIDEAHAEHTVWAESHHSQADLTFRGVCKCAEACAMCRNPQCKSWESETCCCRHANLRTIPSSRHGTASYVSHTYNTWVGFCHALSHAQKANDASHDASDLLGAATSHPESCSSEVEDMDMKFKWDQININNLKNINKYSNFMLFRSVKISPLNSDTTHQFCYDSLFFR